MDGERPIRLRLLDILNAVEGIEQALAGKTFRDYADSDVLQRAVERWLEIISEASRYIPDEWKAESAGIPWRAVAEFGNVARHVYQSMSAVRVWETATNELAALKVVCERYYERVKHLSDPWPDAKG